MKRRIYAIRPGSDNERHYLRTVTINDKNQFTMTFTMQTEIAQVFYGGEHDSEFRQGMDAMQEFFTEAGVGVEVMVSGRWIEEDFQKKITEASRDEIYNQA